MTLLVPDFHTVQSASVVLTLGSLIAMLRFKISMLPVIAVSAALGISYNLWIA